MKHPFKIEKDKAFCSVLNKQVNVLNRIHTNFNSKQTVVEIIPICEKLDQCKEDCIFKLKHKDAIK